MHWRIASPLACSCAALLLAGCGGGEGAARLPAAFAHDAAASADRVVSLLGAGHDCAASSLAVRLQGGTIDAINAKSIPAELQEELLGQVNLLVASIPCGAMERGERDPAALARSLAGWLRGHAAGS